MRSSSGLIGSFPALFGPLGPAIGILVSVCIIIAFFGVILLRGSVGVGLGIILDHACGDSRADQPARGDTALRAGSRFRPQFPGKGTPGHIPRQFRVPINLLSGLLLVRGIAGGRTDSTAIVCDHGNAVHIIIDNARADAKCFGACVSIRFRAGGILHVGRVHGTEGGESGIDGCFIIQGHDAVAVPEAERYHARNTDRIPLAGILSAVLQVHLVVRRGFQGLRSRKLHAFPGHDQAVAADVLYTDRGPDAYFGLRFVGAVGALRAGGSIRRQRYGRAFHLALLSQKHNRVVLQCVDAHGTGQRKRRGCLFLRCTLGAYSVRQDAGFFFGLGFSASTGPRSCSSVLIASCPCSGAGGSSILFRGRRVFSHAGRCAQRYLIAFDLG